MDYVCCANNVVCVLHVVIVHPCDPSRFEVESVGHSFVRLVCEWGGAPDKSGLLVVSRAALGNHFVLAANTNAGIFSSRSGNGICHGFREKM